MTPSPLTLDELWDEVPTEEGIFEPARIAGLPGAARRYLEHAMAPGTRLASAVRLRMHGVIKLRDWLPFTADRVIDGEGEMRWNLFGVLPLMTASGPDVTHSAIGRFQVESIWLPSALCRPGVTWTESDLSRAYASFTTNDEPTGLELVISDTRQLRAASLPRCGQSGREAFQYRMFGGIFDQERTFESYTIPTRVRVGWEYGANPDAWSGEFFRATIDDARYR